MADLGYQGNLYGDEDAYSKFANLSGAQANQSLQAGDVAARYADPFMDERKKQISRLETLQSNPGSIETSPFYKFLMDTQLNAVRASNAARGLTNSGRGAMALQDRAAGVASQAYFPLLQNASQLAQGGSSPAAAGIAYSSGVNRSQDQQQAAAAARAAGQSKPPQAPALPANTPTVPQATAPTSYSYGLPSGGYSGYTDVNTPGYTPSANAGTGYAMSDYGVQDLSGPGSQYYSFGAPSATPSAPTSYSYGDYGDKNAGGYPEQDYVSDFGGGDYGE